MLELLSVHFKLMALLFAMTNGVPTAKPSMVIEIRPGFETREACFGFLQSEEGGNTKKAIENTAEQIDGDVSIKPICVPSAPESGDDGKI